MPLAPFSPVRSDTIRPARAIALGLASAALVIAALSPLRPARAFEALNEAQTLIYDRAHLASLTTGDELVYRYTASTARRGEIADDARLLVDGEADAERRDVTLDFLSDERRLELPPFEGYRGNPILIAMLEHVARSLSVASGGGTLYFRNRIRDGLADENARIESGSATFEETSIETTTLVFEPFRNDAYLGARPGYGEARFRIVFSEDVPGGVVSVAARSGDRASDTRSDTPTGDPTDGSADSFDYELRLTSGS